MVSYEREINYLNATAISMDVISRILCCQYTEIKRKKSIEEEEEKILNFRI